MEATKDKILKDLKNLLSLKFSDNFNDLILFGSQLSDKKTNDSDYDLLIILKNTADWIIEREISDLCYEIDLKYGIITDTHILSEDELDSPRGKQPVFINAISKGYHA